MAERKLNFNAPLLSVRRYSRTASPIGENGKKGENSSRSSRLLSLASCKADSSLDLVTEPVAVPFHWEQIPGKRKNSSKPEDSVAPQFSPRMSLDVVKQIAGEKPEHQDELKPLDSENDDDLYSDAVDTLSATDSFSIHCSVSGLSGFNNLAIVKPSGTFATDPQIRDFMMSRFLPAAKAMTLDQPHYASRNKPVSGEQPRQITNVFQRDRKPPVVRSESLPIVPYHQEIEIEESEDGGDEYSDAGNITTKGCGLIPRLCIKNSLGLLNPVPVMKVKAQNVVLRMKVKAGSHGAKKIDKAAFARSQSPTIKRPTRDADVRSPRVACGSNRQMTSRTSPFNRSGEISPYRNEVPRSPFRGQGFLGGPKEHESFKNNKWNSSNKVYSKSHEIVPYHTIRRGSRPVSPTVEKTLYVDTVNVAGILSSNSGSSNVKKGSNNSIAMSPDRGQSNFAEDLDSKALVCINTVSDQISEEDDSEKAKTSLVVCPLPPILPKTPSESWLWRTLPSVSSHRPLYRGISFQSKRQDPKISSANTKWENIVKSSYLHHDHVRYSEELFPHASQQYKS